MIKKLLIKKSDSLTTVFLKLFAVDFGAWFECVC